MDHLDRNERVARFARFLEQKGVVAPPRQAAPTPMPRPVPVGTDRPTYVPPVQPQRPAMDPAVANLLRSVVAQRQAVQPAPFRSELHGVSRYQDVPQGEDARDVYSYAIPQATDGGEDHRTRMASEFRAYQAAEAAKRSVVGGDRPTVVASNVARPDATTAPDGVPAEWIAAGLAPEQWSALGPEAQQRWLYANAPQATEMIGEERVNAARAAAASDPNTLRNQMEARQAAGRARSETEVTQPRLAAERARAEAERPMRDQQAVREEEKVGILERARAQRLRTEAADTGSMPGPAMDWDMGAGKVYGAAVETGEALQSLKQGDVGPARDLVIETGMKIMEVADTPRGWTVERIGGGMYGIATGTQEEGAYDLEMTRWAVDHPESWGEIRAAHDQGYGGFTGDRAVWEWWIGQQPGWKRAFYDTVLDPTNVAAVGGGLGDNIARAGAEMFADNPQAARLLMGLGKAMAAPQEAMNRTVDKPFEVVGDIVGDLPFVRNLFASSEGQAARDVAETAADNEARLRRLNDYDPPVARTAQQRPLDPSGQPLPVNPRIGPVNDAVPDFQGTAVPRTRTGQARLEPSRVDAPNEPIPVVNPRVGPIPDAVPAAPIRRAPDPVPADPARVDAPNDPYGPSRQEVRQVRSQNRTQLKRERMRERQVPQETFDETVPPRVEERPAPVDPWEGRQDPRTWQGQARTPQRNTLKNAGYSLPEKNLGYHDPGYKRQAEMWETPTIPEQVAFMHGARDPVAGKAFWDEITPVSEATRKVERRLRNAEDAGGGSFFAPPTERGVQAGVSNPAAESVERTVNRVTFDARQEATFERHFGTNPNPYPFQTADTGAPTGTRAIEHVVFGDATTSPAAVDWLLNPATNPTVRTVGGQPIEEVVEELRALRAELGYDDIPTERTLADNISTDQADVTSTVEPVPDAVPPAPFADEVQDAIPGQIPDAAASGVSEVDPTPAFLGPATFDEGDPASLRAHAVDGTPDTLAPDGSRVTGTATRARNVLRNDANLGMGNRAVTELSHQRVGKYGTRDVRLNPDKPLKRGGWAKNAGRVNHFQEAGWVGPGLETPAPKVRPSAEAADFSPFDAARRRGQDAGDATREKVADALESLGVPPPLTDDVAPLPKPTSRAMASRDAGVLATDEYAAIAQDPFTIPAGTKVEVPGPNQTITTFTVKEEWTGTVYQRYEENVARLRDKEAQAARSDKAARKRNPETAAVTERRVAREDKALQRQAEQLTTAEYVAAVRKAAPTDRTAIRKAGRVAGLIRRFGRENTQYSPANLGAAVQDFLGNTFTPLVTGNAGAVKDVPKLLVQTFQRMPEGTMYDEFVDVARESSKLGISTPRKYVGTVADRTQLDPAEKLITQQLTDISPVFAPLQVIGANPGVRRFRQGIESVGRVSVFHNYVRREVPFSRVKFLRSADELAAKLDLPELSERTRALGRSFDPADVRAMTRELGMTDDTLARQWKQEMRSLEKRAEAETDRIYFSYRQTKADAAVSKVFMFHYWMTRATVLHAKTALQHPGLLHAYVSLWKDAERRHDKNLPAWMQGYIRFMGSTAGTVGYVDHIGAFLPFTMFRGLTDDGRDDTALDKLLNRTGLFVDPLVQAAGTMTGLLHNPMDPTMTQSGRGLVISTINWMRNNDIPGVEKLLKPGLTGDPYQNLLIEGYNQASHYASKLSGVFNEMNLPDPDSLAIGKVRGILMEQYTDEYGPMDGWDAETEAKFAESLIALNMGGTDDPMVNEALATYADVELTQDLANVASPADVRVRYGPSDERTRLANEGYGRPGFDRTEGQQDAIDEKRALGAGESDSIRLDSEVRQYQAIGTPEQQETAAAWTQIAFGELPNGSSALIGGVEYTAYDVMRMTDEERMDLAGQWVDDQGPAVAAAFAAYQDERRGFRDAHDLYGEYADYQKMIREGYDDAPLAYAAAVVGSQPDSQFARAYGRKREELADRYPDDAQRVQDGLEAWVRGPEGFMAAKGVQSGLYDPPTGPAVAAAAKPEWSLELTPLGPGSGTTPRQPANPYGGGLNGKMAAALFGRP